MNRTHQFPWSILQIYSKSTLTSPRYSNSRGLSQLRATAPDPVPQYESWSQICFHTVHKAEVLVPCNGPQRMIWFYAMSDSAGPNFKSGSMCNRRLTDSPAICSSISMLSCLLVQQGVLDSFCQLFTCIFTVDALPRTLPEAEEKALSRSSTNYFLPFLLTHICSKDRV
jgi:hypothetical protein